MMIIFAYILAIAAAEAVGVFTNLTIGIFIHMVLIILLSAHYAWQEQAHYRRILPVLLLAPLLRILSLVMPVQQLPQIYWFVLVGIPLLIAAVLAARLLGFSPARLGLHHYARPAQILIALTGLPLGMAAFNILRPEPLIGELDWLAILAGAAILVIFTGFTEELIFRGLLQQVTSEIFGGWAGVLFSSVLFMAMYVGSLSWAYVAFTGLVGLFFGFCVHKTGSIWGVALAHSLMSIGLLIVWPILSSGPG